MIPKLLLMVFAGGVALVGAVLFSRLNFPEENTAPIQQIETISPTPTPQSTKISKPRALTPSPKITATLLPETVLLNTPTPLPTNPLPSATPIPTITPSFVLQTPAPTSLSTPAPEQSTKININTAGKQELEKITGVGPVIAQRIIDYRQTSGPFQKIEDIKKVNGIGDVRFEKMKNQIMI